jgi:hypothetical protein
MSLEAGNWRKYTVTLVSSCHRRLLFLFKKIMRENLSSISNTTYSVCIYWSACLCLQIFNTNKHRYISSNPNNISRYFPLIRDEIVDRKGLNYPGYLFSVFFLIFLGILRWVPNDASQNYKRFSYTGAPLSNTLWRRRAKWNCTRCRAVIPPLALHKLMCSKVLDYSGI